MERSASGAGATTRGEQLALWTLRPLLFLVVVPYGATGDIAMPLALVAGGLWCAVGALCGRGPFPPLAWMAIAAALFLGVWTALQAGGGWSPMLSAGIFAETSILLGQTIPPSPSISPALTEGAVAAILVPLLVYAVTLRLLSVDESAIALLRFIACFGGGIALFGLAQHVLFPDFLILEPKVAYRDNLTAVFVNRNTAATFLGGTVLAAVSLIAYHLGPRPTLEAGWNLLLERGRSSTRTAVHLQLVVLFAAALALGLTSSRAGTAATAMAGALLVVLIYRPAPVETSSLWLGRLRRFGVSMLASVFLLLVLLLFGGRTIDRALESGVADNRFCVFPDMWRAAQAVWPFGTGAGTFELAFRPFRSPNCGIHGVWDRAHSFFLEGLITLGVAFPLVAGCALVGLAIVLGRGVRQRRRLRPLPALGLAILLLLTVHDLVDFSIQITGVSIWAAALLAACCAVCRQPVPSTIGRQRRKYQEV